MELNFKKLREFFFKIGIYSKNAFIFNTGITGWDNLKYLHRVFFQKFTSLLSESLVSKEVSEELEVNKRKRRHEFCRAHGQIQKPISYFTHMSPLEIYRRDFETYCLAVRILK